MNLEEHKEPDHKHNEDYLKKHHTEAPHKHHSDVYDDHKESHKKHRDHIVDNFKGK